MNRPLYYLACPIAHPNPSVVEDRHAKVSFVLAEFMRREWLVYSPLSHHFAIRDSLPRDWAFWEKPSIGMLDKCDVMMVLKLEGWRDSVGVSHEVSHAMQTGKTILYVACPLVWTADELKTDQVLLNYHTKIREIAD